MRTFLLEFVFADRENKNAKSQKFKSEKNLVQHGKH